MTKPTYTIRPLKWTKEFQDWRQAYNDEAGHYTVVRTREDCDPANKWESWRWEYSFSEYYDEGYFDCAWKRPGREIAMTEQEKLDEIPRLDREQRQRAMALAESRGIDDETAHELIYLRDRVALPDSRPIAQENTMLNVVREQIAFNKEYGNTCVESGQQGAAAARYARAEAFTELLGLLEGVTESGPVAQNGASEMWEKAIQIAKANGGSETQLSVLRLYWLKASRAESLPTGETGAGGADLLHIAICQAVQLLNQGCNGEASSVLRQSLVDYADTADSQAGGDEKWIKCADCGRERAMSSLAGVDSFVCRYCLGTHPVESEKE